MTDGEWIVDLPGGLWHILAGQAERERRVDERIPDRHGING